MAGRILVELTEAQADAVIVALSCPLDGDYQDRVAVFVTPGGVRAALAARDAVTAARYRRGVKNRYEARRQRDAKMG